MSRCFVCVPLSSRLDRANLEDFGEVVSLLTRPMIWNADGTIEDLVNRLEEEEFEPATDFAVWSGPAVCLVYFSMAIARYMSRSDLEQDHGYTALAFNTRSKQYQRIAVPLD